MERRLADAAVSRVGLQQTTPCWADSPTPKSPGGLGDPGPQSGCAGSNWESHQFLRRIIALGPRRKLRSLEQCRTKSLRKDSAILSAAQKPSGSALESRPSNAKAALFAAAIIPRNASSSRIRPAHQIDPSRRLGDTGDAVDVFAQSCVWVGS